MAAASTELPAIDAAGGVDSAWTVQPVSAQVRQLRILFWFRGLQLRHEVSTVHGLAQRIGRLSGSGDASRVWLKKWYAYARGAQQPGAETLRLAEASLVATKGRGGSLNEFNSVLWELLARPLISQAHFERAVNELTPRIRSIAFQRKPIYMGKRQWCFRLGTSQAEAMAKSGSPLDSLALAILVLQHTERLSEPTSADLLGQVIHRAATEFRLRSLDLHGVLPRRAQAILTTAPPSEPPTDAASQVQACGYFRSFSQAHAGARTQDSLGEEFTIDPL